MSTIQPDITKLYYTVTVSGGEGTQSLPVGLAVKMIQVIVKPPSEDATYKLYITENIDEIEIFRREDDVVGTYNEIVSPALPLFGDNVFNISDATVDGNYKLRLVYE
jgi:hypothetical protein